MPLHLLGEAAVNIDDVNFQNVVMTPDRLFGRMSGVNTNMCAVTNCALPGDKYARCHR